MPEARARRRPGRRRRAPRCPRMQRGESAEPHRAPPGGEWGTAEVAARTIQEQEGIGGAGPPGPPSLRRRRTAQGGPIAADTRYMFLVVARIQHKTSVDPKIAASTFF